MKNLLKKTLSILTVLAMLLCIVSAFAEEAGETEEKNLPTFEVGGGMSGKLQQDPATEIKVHAGRRGDVLFTLTLAEDCEPGVIYDGGGVFLMRADEKLPVYTFVKHLQWDEYHVISLTAARNTAFSISAELIPEEPAPEAEPEAPATEPEQAPAADQSDDAASEVNPEPESAPAADQPDDAAPEVNPEPEQEEKKEEQQEEITQEEPQTQEEGQQESQEENKEEQEQVTGEEPQTESQETVEGESAEGESKEESEAPAADPAPETGDTVQPEEPVQPETTDDTNEPADQPAADDGQSEDQNVNPEDQTTNPEDEQEGADKPEGAADSVEIIIAATLTPDQSWSGTARKTKPTILKLDVAEAQTIHMLVEGKDTLYSVQKSDRVTEDAGYVLTDAETNRSIISFGAEAGSYLISLLAGENSLGARITVTFMNDEQFEAWEAEQESLAAEQQEETGDTEEGEDQGEGEEGETTEGEPEVTEPETAPDLEGEDEENEPESETESERSVFITLSWDTDIPGYGDVAHFKSTLTGYNEQKYTLQWQTSWDRKTWTDYPGGNQPDLDVTLTKELDGICFRLIVYLEDKQES